MAVLCVCKRERADNPRKIAAVYRLCVCASGSLITDVCNSFTLIRVSCLHLGQCKGKLISTVSIRIFRRVLFEQTGQRTHSVACKFYDLPNLISCNLLSVIYFFFRGSPSARYIIRFAKSKMELQTVSKLGSSYWHIKP